MSKEKVNYWSWKDEALKEQLIKRDLVVENYTRKNIIKALQIDDVTSGKSDEMLVIDAEDEIEEVNSGDELITVRFHNVREDEPPYIFLGHNGKAFYVPKEVDLKVPKYLLDSCVKDAVELRSQSVARGGKMVLETKKVQRFPYTVIND